YRAGAGAGDGGAGERVTGVGAAIEQGLGVQGLDGVVEREVDVVQLDRAAAGPGGGPQRLRRPHRAPVPGLAGFRLEGGVAAGDHRKLRVELHVAAAGGNPVGDAVGDD